jgi:hypothetical protein
MAHIMLDLETMANTSDSAIVSIGAKRFTLDGKELDSFYRVVNLKSSQKSGGRIDAETVMWWMQQSEEARKTLTSDESVLIDTALNEFTQWVRQTPLEGLWGNGSDFDNVILNGAYIRSGKTAPWPYYMNRCYRTLAKLVPGTTREQFKSGTHHNALDDAISQTRHLFALLKELNIT